MSERIISVGVMVNGMGLDQTQILRSVEHARRQLLSAKNRQLVLATSWADGHPPESIDPYQLAMDGGDRPIQPGGDGTPELADFCLAEFATSLGLSIPSAQFFLADALDLRHRLPRIWGRICHNEIDGYYGQFIARETRHLTLTQALLVDRAVAAEIGRWGWSRVMRQVRAKIIEVDAERIRRLAELNADETGVWVGDSDADGTKTLFARAEAADLIWFDAMVDRIADILGRRGDKRCKSARRAAALGVLGNPLRAIWLIAEDNSPSLFDPDPDMGSMMAAPEGVQSGGSDDGPQNPGQPDAQPGAGSDDGCPPPEGSAPDPAANVDTGDPAAFTRVEGPVRFPQIDRDRRLAAAAISAVGALDPTVFLPKATLYVHVALETLQAGLGVTRVEDVGPVVSSQVAAWLADCQVTVKPVIDLNADRVPVDSYEVPGAMRERVFLRQPGSMFPYSGAVGRHLDLDHAIPYSEGVSAQTGDDKVNPAARREHRVITHGLWKRRMPEPGTVVIRAPHGRVILVNQTGSHDLGRGQFAHHIWHAAAPQTVGN